MEELVAKYLSGNSTESEVERVESWRAQSEKNATEFLEYKEIWMLTSGETSDPPNDLLDEMTETKAGRVVGWPGYLKYAAAVVLLSMIGALAYFGSGESSPTDVIVFSGSYEELEDGTVVSLKDGAEITKTVMSDGMRSVEVSGSAFFEVEHDETRPFYVITENAKIRVLGTSFLVNSDENVTEVCVESGLVRFTNNSNMSLNLEKGEMGTIGKDIKGIIKKDITDENFMAWKDGLISFNRAPVSNVVLTLEDTYATEIILPEDLTKCHLTAKFNKKSLEEVIQILSATFNWQYEIDKDKVVLSGEGC